MPAAQHLCDTPLKPLAGGAVISFPGVNVSVHTNGGAHRNRGTTAPIQLAFTTRVISTYYLGPTLCVLKVWILLSESSAAALRHSKRCTQLQYIALVVCCTLLTAGCSLSPNQHAGKVKYANPPKVGTWLQSQRELVACETIQAARHMADFGFFHPQCKQLVSIGQQDYLVESREIVHLKEGPMWLLNVKHHSRIYFVPIPWHDWL